MPRYVRKQPLTERIKAFLNPLDFLLWLSEEIDTNGWDQLEKEWAIPIAIALNIVFMIARANVRRQSKGYDDVFGEVQGQGWASWLAAFIAHFLTIVAFTNAFYTFWRKKHYRLFENAIDNVPSTPSAHRVKVDSSPVSSSPLRYLSSLIGTEAARARAHPDPVKDVWEIAVWDPLPVSLQLFCYFSPGHVIVYWLFLPTLPSDPRPSTTVTTAMALCLLITVQLSLIASRFSQQSKDTSLISKEVLNEYDVKYVRPRTQPVYRDVGTQFTEQASYSEHRDMKYNVVDTFTPTVVINRGFRPNPNPNYVPHVDPDAALPSASSRRQSSATSFRTPAPAHESMSPAKPMTAIRQPVFRPSGVGDGGSLGVYSHASSPLRKSASTNFSPAKIQRQKDASGDGLVLSPERRQRMSVPGEGMSTAVAAQRWGHLKPDRGRRESGRI